MAKKKLKSGDLRHIITLENLQNIQDSYGSIEPVYTKIFNTYANIEPLSGKDFFAANQQQSRISTRITVRFSPKYQQQSRIIYKRKSLDGQDYFSYYLVNTILPDADSGFDYLTLLCEEVTNLQDIEI